MVKDDASMELAEYSEVLFRKISNMYLSVYVNI